MARDIPSNPPVKEIPPRDAAARRIERWSPGEFCRDGHFPIARSGHGAPSPSEGGPDLADGTAATEQLDHTGTTDRVGVHVAVPGHAEPLEGRSHQDRPHARRPVVGLEGDRPAV